MIQGMFDSGAMPALERMAQFTGERNKLIAGNIANFTTPYYKPVDMDPKAFQRQLRAAIDDRRQGGQSQRGPLKLGSHGPAKVAADGKVTFQAAQANENILFHDQNNRDLERTMQDLVENALVHRASIDLIKNQFDMLEMAIRERL
ncbi:MAG: flagellar basal body rod protein FlgB [Phycisphaerales bacterium JB063]